MPALRVIREKLARSLARRGAFGTVRVVVADWAERLMVRWRRSRAVSAGRRFDRRYGVDTAGIIPTSALDLGEGERAVARNYQPIAPFDLGAILSRLHVDCGQFTFVDLGAGKGRAVLIASLLPFRLVIGVELSKRLVAVAAANVDRFAAHAGMRAPVQLVAGNALDFAFPDGPVVLLLYNPFARPVMDVVAGHLEAAFRRRPRRVLVLYFVPACAATWDAVDFLECVLDERDLRVYDTRRGEAVAGS